MNVFSLLLTFFILPVYGQIFTPILDQTNLLDPGWIKEKSQLLENIYREHDIQIQVVMVKSLEGQTIESFSIQLAERLKLGRESTDKGLLLLIAPFEKAARIEVGQGLEGDLPDVVAKRILDDYMIPFFKRNRWEKGIDVGIFLVLQQLGVGVTPALPHSGRPIKDQETSDWIIFVVIVLLLFMRLFLLSARMRGRIVGGSTFPVVFGGGGWPLGGGGGWTGGGGGFSGGGATGRW
ncbi:MAG: TPM domain-containing protein [Bdellovibrionaceae bacterium]|nr:TPM domain-containing protein [Pseudobdellovibrionaceae bacterium]MDW8189996.1 TPM domain-containing protein [Pseudobdellovibrionaceae bacterium]